MRYDPKSKINFIRQIEFWDNVSDDDPFCNDDDEQPIMFDNQ